MKRDREPVCEVRMNIHRKRSNSQMERGQSLVELALSFTVLLILLSGIVDLGRAFFTFMALRDAAQEGAVYGSLFPCDPAVANCGALNITGIVNRVKAASSSPVDMNNPGITIIPTLIGTGLCHGNGIRVEVQWNNFPMIMPFWQTLMGSNTIPIRARIEDTILVPPCH